MEGRWYTAGEGSGERGREKWSGEAWGGRKGVKRDVTECSSASRSTINDSYTSMRMSIGTYLFLRIDSNSTIMSAIIRDCNK